MNLPASFVQQMKARLGAEWPAFLQALDQDAPTSIHLNVFKRLTLRENYDRVKWNTNGLYLDDRPTFTLDPAFHAGAYYVQEASSMLIAEAVRQLVDLSRPLAVLDLCAAPGGKSTLLASQLSPESLLVANEVIRSRFQVLDYNLTKWGITNRMTISEYAEQITTVGPSFDLILVDAPCSGEGLFRKTPAAIEEWSPGQVEACSIRQQKILEHAITLLKPGGILLYSTCTYNDLENSDNASWLSEQFPLEFIPLNLPSEWGIAQSRIGYQCYPHKVRGEGFYLATFRKIETRSFATPPKRAAALTQYQLVGNTRASAFREWLVADPDLTFLENDKGKIFALRRDQYEAITSLAAHLRYFRLGTPIGTFKGKHFIPDPALALSNIVRRDLPAIEVELESALQYLKGETPDLPGSPGWHLIRYQGLNLGWAKLLGNRMNNYYPKEWRIRMQIQ